MSFIKKIFDSSNLLKNNLESVDKLKERIKSLEKELDSGYTALGKSIAYAHFNCTEKENIDSEKLLNDLKNIYEEIQSLETEIIEVEKKAAKDKLLKEKAALEKDFLKEKDLLDKALVLEDIDKTAYDKRITELRKAIDNFDAIKKIEKYQELGILKKEEAEKKIEELLN
ncbi:hypothetical protein [Clostridium sp.]|uniref:hypothetical protein n=1 Tax=Clostridium sp. TaxID=1506 RepID=UPI003463B9EB